MRKKGGNLVRAKQMNVSLIKEMIYKHRMITRTEIANRLSLTLPTVTAVVNQMLKEGVLIEKAIPNRAVGMGRKPVALDFCENKLYFIGLELKQNTAYICILDLAGKVVIQDQYDSIPEEYSRMKLWVLRHIEDIIKKSGIERKTIRGIGIGLPGVIQGEKGYIYRNSHKDWKDRYLAQDLTKQIGLDTIIENNVRVRAVAIELKGDQTSQEPMPDNFAYFYVSTGIACSMVIKDAVYTGYQAGAGELGHTVAITDGPICEVCGNRGCLEEVAGERTILREYRDLKLKKTGKKYDEAKIEDVLQDYKNDDPDVIALLNSKVKYLAVSLANVINYVCPQRLYIDGYIFREKELRNDIIESARLNLYSSEECEVVFLPFDSHGGAKAAAYYAIKHLYIEKD